MRIVFFGATELGYECCRQLVNSGEEVVGILSIPREFSISYSHQPVTMVTHRSFEDLAAAHRIPLVHVAGDMNDSRHADTLRIWQPDLGVVVGWYYVLPRRLRDLFQKGVVGIHASLLPKYRGGAPLVWAIINGESRTGATLFYLDDGVDTGDMIAQVEFDVEKTDTIKTAYEKATQASLTLLRDNLPLIASNQAPRFPQDHRAATQFPQRGPQDGVIDWSWNPDQIRNFIRAQTKPYPGAFSILNGKKITIWDADVSEAREEEGPCHQAPLHREKEPDIIILTLDIDWAPDFVIDFVAAQLVKHEVKATWFCTHRSEAIARLRRYPELFELGIHPNFLPGSTQGNTPEEVLRSCMSIVPEAISTRSHALVQSTPLLYEILKHTPVRIDSSLFLPRTSGLRPVDHVIGKRSLKRVPCYWQDFHEMEAGEPSWRLSSLLGDGGGLKVLDFHPIHVYLNSSDLRSYSTLKSGTPHLSETTPQELEPFVGDSDGTRRLFLEVVTHLSQRGHSMRLKDLLPVASPGAAVGQK